MRFSYTTLAVTSLVGLATASSSCTIPAQTCAEPVSTTYLPEPCFPKTKVCYPTSYYAAQDQGQMSASAGSFDTQMYAKCKAVCDSQAQCASFVGIENITPDRTLATGTCFFYSVQLLSPRQCADSPSRIIAYYKANVCPAVQTTTSSTSSKSTTSSSTTTKSTTKSTTTSSTTTTTSSSTTSSSTTSSSTTSSTTSTTTSSTTTSSTTSSTTTSTTSSTTTSTTTGHVSCPTGTSFTLTSYNNPYASDGSFGSLEDTASYSQYVEFDVAQYGDATPAGVFHFDTNCHLLTAAGMIATLDSGLDFGMLSFNSAQAISDNGYPVCVCTVATSTNYLTCVCGSNTAFSLDPNANLFISDPHGTFAISNGIVEGSSKVNVKVVYQ